MKINKDKTKSFSTISIIFSILAIVFFVSLFTPLQFLPIMFVGEICAVISLITGIIGVVKARKRYNILCLVQSILICFIASVLFEMILEFTYFLE